MLLNLCRFVKCAQASLISYVHNPVLQGPVRIVAGPDDAKQSTATL